MTVAAHLVIIVLISTRRAITETFRDPDDDGRKACADESDAGLDVAGLVLETCPKRQFVFGLSLQRA
jgi:hypothetical protein